MIIIDSKLEPWFDKAVQKHCEQEKKHNITGSAHFLIGSFLDGGDIQVAHITRCPAPTTALGEEGDATSKTVDDEWIVDNAEKVIRVLPGGVNIVGLVWMSNKKVYIDQKTMLIKALTRIARTTNSLTTLNLSNISDQLALVSVETPNGKPQGIVVDVVRRGPDSPMKVSFSQVEWLSVVSRACGRIGQNLNESSKDDFYSDFTALLKPWVENLFKCDFILVDGEVKDGSEALFKDPKKRKKSSVELAIFLDGNDTSANGITTEKTSNWYDLVFDIEVRAAVPVKGNVASAIAAAKQHIVRNLCARAVLHYESMELTEDTASPSAQTVHQMPRPATTTLPNHSAILFSDFLFEADSVEDAQKNMAEILEISANIEHVDDGWERALEVDEMESVRAPGIVPDHAPLLTSLQPTTTNNTMLILALSAIVAIVAVVMYMALGK